MSFVEARILPPKGNEMSGPGADPFPSVEGFGPMPDSPSVALLPPLEPIDPRPDLAPVLPEEPNRTFDSEIPYIKEEVIPHPGLPETDNAQPSPSVAGAPIEHAPIVATAPRRAKSLSDYYGVFGPPRKKEE